MKTYTIIAVVILALVVYFYVVRGKETKVKAIMSQYGLDREQALQLIEKEGL